MGFIESYKHLEKLCGEVLNDDRRISAYIDEMINNIKIDTVRYLFHVKVEAEKPQRERVAKETGASHGGDSQEIKKKPVKKEPKVGRNDLCPCGSGKKYKSCCGREVV